MKNYIKPPYQDEFGLIQDKNGSSGNGILYSAEYLMATQDEDRDVEVARILRGVDACEDKGDEGLYYRRPSKDRGEQQQIDDYIGLAAIAVVYDRLIARKIVQRGRSTGWVFQTEFPERLTFSVWWRMWFGKWPAMIATLEWASYWTPEPWMRAYWSFCVASSGLWDKHPQDPWILSALMIFVINRQPEPLKWYEKWGIWINAKRRRGKKLSAYLEESFQDPNHPTVIALKEKGL